MRIVSKFLYSAVFLSVISCGEKRPGLVVKNPTDNDLESKPIVIKKQDLAGSGKWIAVYDENNKKLNVQHDDLDGDGNWDEIVFLANIPSISETEFTYQWNGEKERQPLKVQARLGVSKERNGTFSEVTEHVMDSVQKAQVIPQLYQLEGVVWENDKIGFRLYFDERNGKDIFGKQQTELVLDSIKGGYHKLKDWGMDVLKVGTSLGAGSLAMKDGEGKLHRLGNTPNVKYKQLVEGPVRAIFELVYPEWIVNKKTYQLTERIEIVKGEHAYRSQIKLVGPDYPELVAGVVNLKFKGKETVYKDNGGWSVYSFGKQSENGDLLGMALTIPEACFASSGRIEKDPETDNAVSDSFYASLKPENGIYEFDFVSGWELADKRFKDKKGFEDYLQKWVIMRNTPISVEVRK
ncbi:DUF4861 family protein [Fulvitalea axinellae]